MKKYDDLKRAINNTIIAFIQNKEQESITDWQGNNSFEGEKMYVIRNIIFETSIPLSKMALQADTGCDLPWAEDHFQERISGVPTNPGETYKYWPYHKNLDNSEYKTEIFSHTYQERFWPKEVNNVNPINGGEGPNWGLRFKLGDLDDVINLLYQNPKTRQAYLPIWFPEDTWAANNNERVPCTLGYYFWVKDNELHCNYTIRSCDLFRHFRNDVYLTARLMQYISLRLSQYNGYDIHAGKLTMIIYNLHLFEKDLYPFSKKENKIREQWKE